MIGVEVVRACERLYAKEMYQSWLWSVLGIARRRGGAMLADGDLQAVAAYRGEVRVVVEFLFSEGADVARSIGERRALRVRDAFEGTEFVLGLALDARRGADTHVNEGQAFALAELRKATQPVVDAILALVRVEQELPLSERGGETSGYV